MTPNKLEDRFFWRAIKGDIYQYVRSCHECQMNKSKQKQRLNEMTLPIYTTVPFEVVHVNFAKVKKKSEGVART